MKRGIIWGLELLGVLLLVMLYRPCWSFFGMGYCDLFTEIFLVAAAAVVLALIVFLPYVIFIKRRQMGVIVWQRAIPIAVVFFALLAIPQFIASHSVAKVKLEFWKTVQTGDRSVQGTEEYDGDGEQFCTYDYGGALDPILEKRDRLLFNSGFVYFGRWWVCDRGTWTCMFYVYCPPLARWVCDSRRAATKSSALTETTYHVRPAFAGRAQSFKQH